MKYAGYILAAILFAALLVVSGTLYVVNETEQVIVTQFGKPVGGAITEAGLHWKIPFIQKVNTFDKRWLEWDGFPNQIPTQDKKYIHVDTYARWRIADPLLFFQSVRDERGAQSRLDDILDGETRNAIANFPLIEIVRATDRVLPVDTVSERSGNAPPQVQIRMGREAISQLILQRASVNTPSLGIELVDVRIKRINYIEEVRRKVYDRMISERLQIAEKSRSEGKGRSAEIRGEKEKELKRIISEAYKTAEEIKGKADAEAANIYASAYQRDPDFYAFVETMTRYPLTIDSNTTFVTSTDGEFFRYLEEIK